MTRSSMRRSPKPHRPSRFEGPSPSEILQDAGPEDTVVVIGGGRFGERAARLLSRDPNRSVWVVDRAEARESALSDLPVQLLCQDGIDFLTERFPSLAEHVLVVPAVPIHLAAEWLRRMPFPGLKARVIPVPDRVRPELPHTWVAAEGSLLVSYADFLCPEDCPEPEDGCTVTGEIRTPLYEVLEALSVPGFDVHVIRSRQLAPGVGGYRIADLEALQERVLGRPGKKWLVGTACRCHGTITGLEIGKTGP